MKRAFLLLVVFLILFSGTGKKAAHLECHKTYSAEQLKEDFKILVTTLREVHPDLYRVNSKAQIDKTIESIRRELEAPKSYLEFLRLIAPLFTEIGCVNTQWGHSAEFIRYRNENIPLFPLQLSIHGDRFFVKANYSNDTSIEEGYEILKINNEKISAYLEKNYPLLPTDGKIKSIKQRWLESYFPQHNSNFWSQPDTFVLSIKDASGKISKKRVRAMPDKEIRANKEKHVEYKPPLEFYIDSSIGVFTIRSFNAHVLDKAGMNFKMFVDSCFGTIRDEKIQTLIIDLRGEGWGNSYYGMLLYSFLGTKSFTYLEEIKAPGDTNYTYRKNIVSFPGTGSSVYNPMIDSAAPETKAFTGDLYVITDGWDVGAKGLFCARVSERPHTFFVGEECGSSTFGTNELPLVLLLPNTGIRVFIPTTQLRLRPENYRSVKGVKIDYPLEDAEDENAVEKTIGLIFKPRQPAAMPAK